MPGNDLLYFIADTGWDGILDLERWFCHQVPQSAALSSASWSPAQLEALFINCVRPIDGLPQDLAYQRLESKGVETSSVPPQACAYMTSKGRVWLHTFPSHLTLDEGIRHLKADALPLSIQFQIGYSHIYTLYSHIYTLLYTALLKRVQRGNVILVIMKNVRVPHQTMFCGALSKLRRDLSLMKRTLRQCQKVKMNYLCQSTSMRLLLLQYDRVTRLK
ncbi:MAG: hypothetical protein ACR5LF_05675 [Symbiopectobacterium sp.]